MGKQEQKEHAEAVELMATLGFGFDKETGEFYHLKGKPLTPEGRETPDPTPMQPPLGYFKQPTMVDHIRNLIRSERLREAAEAGGAESFEEADDFNVGDDYDPHSGYETEFEPEIPQSAASADDESGAAAEPEPKAPSPSPAPEKKD